MKKLFSFLLYAIMLFTASCAEGYDDSQIWNKLNSLENRVAALEQLCRQMNTNISSLQTVVNALQNNDYVTNIAPITMDGKVIGYTIVFSKSGAVTIYHGKDGKDGADGANGADGKDGYTPAIGVAKDTDGIYYWTLDGDWLLDKDGNKIKAEGVDGKDGQDGENGEDGQDGVNGADGISPKLKIENDYWYISYDNGVTWEELGKATGEDGKNGADGKDGDSMFKDITYDDDFVYITLIDGSQFIVPRYMPIQPYEIWYTSSDGNIVIPFRTNVFGATIISNEYKDGKGIITFDKNVTEIGAEAFYNCDDLTSVTFPNSTTSIGAYTFAYCDGLTSVTIPNSITEIGVVAYIGCKSLTSVTILNSNTSIGHGAFSKCSSLVDVYCKATTPPTAQFEQYNVWEAFADNAYNRKIYVPAASVDAYKAAIGWSEYANNIVGYDFE
ncbi:MAG: leucine-rich repeat protein [Alistipes sp.]|nr:leucine-rich repeat protein [Alistipes sp.]